MYLSNTLSKIDYNYSNIPFLSNFSYEKKLPTKYSQGRSNQVVIEGYCKGEFNYSNKDVIIKDVVVIPYALGGGSITVYAKNIIIEGIIDAAGSGYGGGGGGGGGGGILKLDSLDSIYYRNSSSTGGQGVGGGNDGLPGNMLTDENHAYNGGNGGKGGGLYGGDGGIGGIGGFILRNLNLSQNGLPGQGSNGGIGGYLGKGINGDFTDDDTVFMGSGGGGGGGGGGTAYIDKKIKKGSSLGSGGGGGGAGNAGGGCVKLYASQSIILKGQIYTCGLISSSGNGQGEIDKHSGVRIAGAGGNANEVGLSIGRFNGGNGGPGAGGGVLLKGKLVVINGLIDARGGGGYTINGGTVKIFYNELSMKKNFNNIEGGRIFFSKFAYQ